MISSMFHRATTLNGRWGQRWAAAPADAAAVPARAPIDRGGALCAHFTGARGDYDLSVDEGAPEDGDASLEGFVVAWRHRLDGMLAGRVSRRGTVVCEAVLLGGSTDGSARQVRNQLRREGVSHRCAAALARMPQRPLLATFARGPELSSEMLRRVHRLLISAEPAL